MNARKEETSQELTQLDKKVMVRSVPPLPAAVESH